MSDTTADDLRSGWGRCTKGETPPLVDQVLHVLQIGAICPSGLLDPIGPTRSMEPVLWIVQGRRWISIENGLVGITCTYTHLPV